MLEVFFDNDKVFSFFKAILENDSEAVNCFELLFNLGVDEENAADMLKAFVFLGILEETNQLHKGIFKFKPYSPIVLGLCFFDEFIGKYCEERIANEREEDNTISFEDFVAFFEKNVEDISFEEMMDLLKENGFL